MALIRKRRYLIASKDEKIRDLMRENSLAQSSLRKKDEEIYDLKQAVQMLSYTLCGRVGLTDDTREALIKAVKHSHSTSCPSEDLRGGLICIHSCMDCWIYAAKKFKKEKSVFIVDNLRRW